MKSYCYSLAGILAMSLPLASVRADNASIIPSQNHTNTSAYGKGHHHKHHDGKGHKEHKHKKHDHEKDHKHHGDEDKGNEDKGTKADS